MTTRGQTGHAPASSHAGLVLSDLRRAVSTSVKTVLPELAAGLRSGRPFSGAQYGDTSQMARRDALAS
jgi:hypothetical protein